MISEQKREETKPTCPLTASGANFWSKHLCDRHSSSGISVSTTLVWPRPCLLYRIKFEDVDALQISDGPLYGAVYRLVAASLAEDCERLKVRVSTFVDALYSKPLRKPIQSKTLRAIAAMP